MEYQFARFQNTVCTLLKGGIPTMYCVNWKMTILFLTYIRVHTFYILYLRIIMYFALIYIYI